MARSLVIEEERGICSGFAHPHNGYYAGEFSGRLLGSARPDRGASATLVPTAGPSRRTLTRS